MGFTYKNYTESDEVKKKREEAEAHKNYVESASVTNARNDWNTHSANKVSEWTGGSYGGLKEQALNDITNREKFSYDINGDVLYQQYKNQYINQGKLAMLDTLGQASALTGGYGSSYASTVGNQAYQSYLQQLNDVVPTLYQLAYDKYNNDTQDMYNKYNLYNDAYNTEYGEYRDKVSDWYTEDERLSNKYYNESNMDYSRFDSDRTYYQNAYTSAQTFDYNKYNDDYTKAWEQYKLNQQLAAAAAQAAASQAASQAAATPAATTTNTTAKVSDATIVKTIATYGNNAATNSALKAAGATNSQLASARKYVAKDKQVANRL